MILKRTIEKEAEALKLGKTWSELKSVNYQKPLEESDQKPMLQIERKRVIDGIEAHVLTLFQSSLKMISTFLLPLLLNGKNKTKITPWHSEIIIKIHLLKL